MKLKFKIKKKKQNEKNQRPRNNVYYYNQLNFPISNPEQN